MLWLLVTAASRPLSGGIAKLVHRTPRSMEIRSQDQNVVVNAKNLSFCLLDVQPCTLRGLDSDPFSSSNRLGTSELHMSILA